MIGNDVVDLDLAKTQSNWKRKGFLDKIFTHEEQNCILNAVHPEEMVWNLWSRKEAVYKIIMQRGGKCGYYPLKIKCTRCTTENGIVTFENEKFYTKTILYPNYIYTLAVVNQEHFTKIRKSENPENFIKIEGIPFYTLNSKLHAASKTHHGKFEHSVYLE